MLLRRQQSNCSTPPHRVPWGNKHIAHSQWILLRRDIPDPTYMRRIRGETKIHRSWLLWRTRLKPPDAWGTALFWLSWENRKIDKFSEKQSLPNTSTYMGEEEKGLKITFILIFPLILLSFPLLPSRRILPPLSLSTSPFFSPISYLLAPFPSLQVFVHMLN